MRRPASQTVTEFRVIDADTGNDLSGPIRGTLPPGYLNQFRVNPHSPVLRRLRVQSRTVTTSHWEDYRP